jgi:PfaD family protein
MDKMQNVNKRYVGPMAVHGLDLDACPSQLRALLDVGTACTVRFSGAEPVVVSVGGAASGEGGPRVPALRPEELGSAGFRRTYGTRYAYFAGAMANAIASEALVIALGKAGFMGVFGAAGCLPERVEAAIRRIQAELPDGPYAFNLIHSPYEPLLESGSCGLYLKYGVKAVEASAFLDLTSHIVYYRAAGLSLDAAGNPLVGNHVIAKVSRSEVAEKFMRPAPERLLSALVAQDRITPLQAELALKVPMADDITVEADSAGHTDNRPLVVLLPTILALRDRLYRDGQIPVKVRVGAGGGISTPAAALAAFAMGADYVVTGSINQACVEAGASEHTRKLLSQADMADTAMAPASDMFEMGVSLQVLKRGTMFAMRAQRLYELYRQYPSLDAIPPAERERLEKQVFRHSLEHIWQETINYFMRRSPATIEEANRDPKKKMALVFRWYLGLSSHWSNSGEKGREMDYQIWAGPAMGAFNSWVKGTYLDDFRERHVVDVAHFIMYGAALTERLNQLRRLGCDISVDVADYIPRQRERGVSGVEASLGAGAYA